MKMTLALRSSPKRQPETDADWISLYSSYASCNRLVLLDCCTQSATRLARLKFRKRLDCPSFPEPMLSMVSPMEVDGVSPLPDLEKEDGSDGILPMDEIDSQEGSPPKRVLLRVSTSPSPVPPPVAQEESIDPQLPIATEQPILSLYDFPESQQIEVNYDASEDIPALSNNEPPVTLLQTIPEEEDSLPEEESQQENEEPTSQVVFLAPTCVGP